MAITKKPVPATSETSDPFSASGFTAKRSVTLSSWKWVNGEPKFFKVLGPVHFGTGTKGSIPPSLCLVRDLKTKTHYQLILGKMILDAFNDSYPGDSIIGKCFGAVRYDVPVPDKPGQIANWKRYDVREIDPPEDETEDES